MSDDGYWEIVDSRTGRLASASVWLTEESLLSSIKDWYQRDAKGGRPDVHDLLPFLEPRFVEWGEEATGV